MVISGYYSSTLLKNAESGPELLIEMLTRNIYIIEHVIELCC
jgi:hypothetical protein